MLFSLKEKGQGLVEYAIILALVAIVVIAALALTHRLPGVFTLRQYAEVGGLLALMEPIMIVFLGVVVGGMVVAMYLPIFKLGAAI